MQVASRSVKYCLLLSIFLLHTSFAQAALRLTASDPANNATNAQREGTVATLTFSVSLNPGTVSSSSVILRRGSIKETIMATATANQITVQPSTELLPATSYTLTVSGVQGSGGEQLSSAINIVFKTRDGAWQSAAAVSQSNMGVTGNQLAFNKHDDTGMTIWIQKVDSSHKSILASRYNNGQWDTSQVVVNTADDIFEDAVAVGSGGTAVAAWTEILSGGTGSHLQVWASVFTPSTGWAAPQMIDIADLNAFASGHPEAAILPNGKIVVVWDESTQGTSRILSNEYTATDGWGAATPIDAFSHHGSFDPEIAFDNKGNGYAVWTQTWQGKSMVWGNLYLADRGWIAPQIISLNKPDFAAGPQIVFDDGGNALAVWNETDGLYAAKYIHNQGWTAEALVTHEEAFDYGIAVNGAGNAFATWTELKAVGENSQGITQLSSSVFAARYTTSGGWETPVSLQFANGYDAGNATIAMDAAGNAVAVWWGNNGPSNYSRTIVRIYANRYVVGSGWVNRKVIDTTNTYGAYSFPNIAIDASGNALAVWAQQSLPNTINTDIWFNRFD